MAENNSFDDYFNQPAPQPPASTSPTPQSSRSFDEYFKPEASKQQGSYLQSAGKGAAGTLAGPLPLTGFEPPEQMQAVSEKNQQYLQQTSEQKQAELNKAFPNPATDTAGKVIEKGAEGATYGALTGPAGIIPGALSGAAAEYHNIKRPDHPYENFAVGMGAGLATPAVTKPLEFAAKTGRSLLERMGIMESPTNSLYRDIGGAGLQSGDMRVAGANNGPEWLMQMQNALREGLGSRGHIVGREQELFKGVENRAKDIADRLGPDLTHQELGEFIQGNIPQRAEQIHQEIKNLYTALNTVVPHASNVPPTQFIQRLNDITQRYGGTNLGAVFNDPFVERTIMAAHKDIATSGGTLPYDVLHNMRSDIGESVKKGALDPNINVKMLRGLYGALTTDMESAYSGAGLRAWRTVNASAEHSFDNLERLQAFNKLGMTPEDITTRLLSQTKKGASRIDDITTQLNNVDPGTRDTVLGFTLRRMGETPSDKTFNPGRFYDQWQQLSPEVKDLFPKAQQEGIERLAQISGIAKDSFAAANRSHTSGNLNILDRLGTAMRGLVEAAVSGGGAGATYMATHDYGATSAAGMTGYGLGKALAATIGESGVNNMLGRLWTNKTFNTWLATEAPNLTPDKLQRSLGALAGQAPEIANDLNTLGSMAGQQTGLMPGEKPRFAEGGYSGWPEQTPFEEGGPVGDPTRGKFIAPQDKINRINELTKDRLAAERGEKAAGSPSKSFTEIATGSKGYAEGGPTPFETKLSPEEELKYQIWKAEKAPHDSGEDYDLRGAFKAGLSPAENGHWSDRFKKPNHETFSNESDYAKDRPEAAGTWQGEKFISPAGYALGGLTDTFKPNAAGAASAGKVPNISEQNIIPPAMPKGYLPPNAHNMAEGGNVVANENEPPGSLIDQFLNHNASVIPFKSGAGGKYNNQDFMGYHMGNTSNPAEGTTIGFMDKVTPKDVLNYNPQKSNVFWGNDMPVETAPGANDNLIYPPPKDFYMPKDSGMAQGGIAHDIEDQRPHYNPQLPRVIGGGWKHGGLVSHKRGDQYNPQPDTSGKDGSSDGSEAYATGGPVSGSEIGGYAEGGRVLSDEENLALIHRYESKGGQNIPNFRYDSGHTAQGVDQITNTTWRNYAPKDVLAKYPNAMSAPAAVQDAVAKIIMHSPQGMHHWLDFNPTLKAAYYKATGGQEPVVEAKAQGSKSIIDHFLGESDTDANPIDQEAEQQTATETPEQEPNLKASLGERALNEVPFAEPLTKYAIKGIWDNANI